MLAVSTLGIIGGVASWNSTSYAITDRRVMARYGVFTKKFAECHHDRIQNTTVVMPFFLSLFSNGVIIFATSGFTGGINAQVANKMQSSGGAIVWYGINNPGKVKRYAADIIEQSQKLAKKRELESATVIKEARKTTEERLQEAKGLREKDIVSEEEYQALRKKILTEI